MTLPALKMKEGDEKPKNTGDPWKVGGGGGKEMDSPPPRGNRALLTP